MNRHTALKTIDKVAFIKETSNINTIKQLLMQENIQVDIEQLKRQLLYACDVTINFHPDRISNNGDIIISNLLDEGKYHNQYKTGTSNGGRTAHIGGDRDLWEKRLFQGVYHSGDIELFARPKYGALNIHNYIDGASARFGSCFFTLKPHIVERCTFAFGDSSDNPDIFGTSKHFWGIVNALLQEVECNGNLLNANNFSIEKAISYICSMNKYTLKTLGFNLDYCIETHIHGDVDLRNDVDRLYLDNSFIGTDIEESAMLLAEKYDVALYYIPDRSYDVDKIDYEWKGPLARPLAERIVEKFGDSKRIINARLIGLSSQDSIINSADWLDIGNEFELFQNFKYLWHYVAYQKE